MTPASTGRQVRLVNPLGQPEQAQAAIARRLTSLDGKAIGFIDNIKPNAGLFLQYIEQLMRAEHPGMTTHNVRKNFTSSKLIADQLDGKVDAVVNAWGD
jgi:hypothetical protein